MLKHWKLIFLPCLLLLCCTVPHLEQGDFRRDTGRYAAVGLYMWEHGPLGVQYLEPDLPYFNKPPLATLIHGLFLKVFGVSLVAARIPSILAAVGVVILSVLTLRQVASRTEALVSGLVLATTSEFFRRTREISLDFWQLFFLMAAVYLVVRSLQRNSMAGLLLAGVPIGLALLCKPLVALAMMPVLAIWAVMMGKRRAAVCLVTGTVAVAVIVAAPWHLYMWSLFGDAFTKQYFGHEVLDRAQGKLVTQPFYFYLASCLKNYWPWLPAVVWAVWLRWFRAGRSVRTVQGTFRDSVPFAAVWVAYVLLVLSLFPDKKPNYALPIYPMLSWLAAAGLCRLPWRKLRRWRERQFVGLAPTAAALLVLLSVLPIRFQAPPDKDWQAFYNWLREKKIPPADIRYQNIPSGMVSCFYLRTGVFPRRFKDRTVSAEDASYPVLMERGSKNDPPLNSPALFSSGKVVVILSTHLTAFPAGN